MSQFSNVSLPGDANAPYRAVGEGVGILDYGAQNVSNANVLFYLREVPDPEASREHGRPMVKALEYVRIQQPMTRDTTDRPLSEARWAITRYPVQWAQYQKSMEQRPDGTPVSVLFPQNPEIVTNLKQYGVYVIEQLAGALDADLQNIPIGGTQMRDRAQKYLQVANKGVAYHQMQKMLAERDNKLEVLTNQMQQLRGELDRLMSERRGVPTPMIPTAPQPQAYAHAMSLPGAPRPISPYQERELAPAATPGAVYPSVVPPAPPAAPLPVRAWTPPQPSEALPWPPEAADTQGVEPPQAQGVVGPSIDPPPPQSPPQRGWPKGKPRKPVTPTQG